MDAEYYEVEQGEDITFPPHVHRCYEAVYGLSGALEITVDGETYRLEPGDIALICPNQVHAFHTPQHSRHALVIFAPEVIAAFDRTHTQRLPSHPVIRVGEQHPVYRLLCTLDNESGIYAIKGALYALCAEFEKQTSFQEMTRGHGGSSSLLREILNFVQRNFKEECTLSALAAEIKYDMSYLSKFFMNNVGISFTSYVNQVRISHARYLLLNTEMTVLEISHACGNTSLRTFNRNFLTQTGCTPNQYRKGKQAGGL
jgi:AraC-like DNA-binding protein